MHLLSDVELRVMLVACRQTLGWHRENAELSISYLQSKTGKSKQGVRDGVKKNTERNWLKKVGTGKRNVSIYAVDFSDVSTQLTGTCQHSRQEHVNTVDTVNKEKEKKEKKIPAHSAQAATTPTATPQKTEQRAIVRHESGFTVAPLVTGAGLLEDHNLPGANITPLTDVPPGNVANRAYFDEKRRRIVTVSESPPPPANLAASPMETSQDVPAPEKPAKKKTTKKKPKYTREQRDTMKAAVLDAVGWQESDVKSWALITRVVTKLLDQGTPIELIAEWRDWNKALDCGKSENPNALVGNAWPRFMKWKREQEAKRKVTTSAIIEDDSKPLDLLPGAYSVGE
jgi:hypothetical protein